MKRELWPYWSIVALIALLLAACPPAKAQSITLTPRPDLVRVGPPGSFPRVSRWEPKPWEFAVAVALGAADVASSVGLYEMNPVLGRGPFGVRQAAVKGVITGGALYGAWAIRKRHPKLAWAIVITAGASSAFGAAHNFTIRWGNR